MVSNDTIYAPASGQGGSAVAIIRISGHEAGSVLEALTTEGLPDPRRATLRKIRAADGAILDEALVLWFPEDRSFTGEPVVEIQGHGGRATVMAILEAISAQHQTRLADPGEFTRRAVLNGRLSLLEADGLRDLVAAETEAQRRQALRTMSGDIGNELQIWRDKLIRARALVEATIDWADEDVPEDVAPEVWSLVGEVVTAIEREMGKSLGAQQLHKGFEVALIGPPNVGKSSLLNALAGREAAIVSRMPGTTRDVVELRYDVDGLPVTFLDTAGLRETSDEIEAVGVERAEQRAGGAAFRLHLVSSDCPLDSSRKLWREGDLRVWAKCDLAEGEGDVCISTVTGAGLDTLISLISGRLGDIAVPDALLGQAWQVEIAQGILDIGSALLSERESCAPEILAEELRRAADNVDRLSGRSHTEDMLDEVFSSFCLGK